MNPGRRIRRLVPALLLGLLPSAALCQTINVLWYTYAHPTSIYRQTIQKLADVVHTLPESTGLRWKLAFFGPDSPTPAFGDYNVLVIHSGETGFTGPHAPNLPKQPNAAADFRGILKNKARIMAARGERTFITGSDADVHMINGETGNAPQSAAGSPRPWTCDPVITGAACWDGALGHLVNAVNWAASGRGLGIVSLVAAEFPGSLWWGDPESFLRAELDGYVTIWGSGGKVRENSPAIPAATQKYALNYGLTTRGLSNWKNSFHAGFSKSIPGYVSIVDSTLYPNTSVAIATAKFASASANGPEPVAPAPARTK